MGQGMTEQLQGLSGVGSQGSSELGTAGEPGTAGATPAPATQCKSCVSRDGKNFGMFHMHCDACVATMIAQVDGAPKARMILRGLAHGTPALIDADRFKSIGALVLQKRPEWAKEGAR